MIRLFKKNGQVEADEAFDDLMIISHDNHCPCETLTATRPTNFNDDQIWMMMIR